MGFGNVYGQAESTWLEVHVKNDYLKFIKENPYHWINQDSMKPFFIVLDHQYGNYAKDTILINKPGRLMIEMKISKPEMLLIWIHGHVVQKYILTPGKIISIRPNIQEENSVTRKNELLYTIAYLNLEGMVKDTWNSEFLSPAYISKIDFTAYKLHIANIKNKCDSILSQTPKNLSFAPFLKRLQFYNRYLWAKSYIDFIRYKHETEAIKKFNTVSEADLKPVLNIIEEEGPVEYKELRSQISSFIYKIRQANYQTALLFRSEAHCLGYESKWAFPAESNLNNNLSGYGNFHGDFWAQKPVFEEAGRFNERTDLAIVKYQGKYGVIHTCFEYVVPAVYDHLKWVSDNLLICVKDGLHGVINTKNKEIITPRFPALERMSRNGTLYPPDSEKYLMTFIYSDYSNPKDVRVGLVDTNNQLILPALYSGLTLLNSGYILFFNDRPGNKNPRTYGVIDPEGNTIIPEDTHYIEEARLNHEPFFIVKKESGNKLVNRKGVQIYEGLLGEYFYEQLRHVFIFGCAEENIKQFHVFGKNGKKIINNPVVDYRVYDNHVAVTARDKNIYLISDNPAPVVEDIADHIDSLTYYTYSVKKGKIITVCDRYFNKLISVNAEQLFVSDEAILKDTSANRERLYGIVALRNGALYQIDAAVPSSKEKKIRKAGVVVVYRYEKKFEFTLNTNGLIIKLKQIPMEAEHNSEELHDEIQSKSW